jgi:hypothetical protein
MLSTIANAAKSTKTTQNCQNLPESTQRQNFEIPQKIEILAFSKIKMSMHRRGTRACFHHSDSQSKNFSYA